MALWWIQLLTAKLEPEGTQAMSLKNCEYRLVILQDRMSSFIYPFPMSLTFPGPQYPRLPLAAWMLSCWLMTY
jgi:hypothetical protein